MAPKLPPPANTKAVFASPAWSATRPGMTTLRRARRGNDSALDERLFNDKMAGLAVAAFGKTARFKHLAQFFQHPRTAAHHDAIRPDIQRRLTDIVKQLFRRDQVGDPAAVAERLAGDGPGVKNTPGQQQNGR